MAVPTLSACAPSSVFTGGQLVTLTGTNFQTAYPLPDVNGPLPPPLPTVAVTFNGRPARRVSVLSSTSLTCIAPAGDPGAATITLKNLDDEGEPIPGEEVSAALATYARADLSAASDLQRVVRALLRMLKREVLENVVLTVSTDFTDDAGKLEFNITQIAGPLPCVTLGAPTLRRNRFYGSMAEVEQRGTNWVRRRYMHTSDIVCKVGAYDNSETRMLNIHALLIQALENNTYLEVQRDPDDADKGSVYYELDITEEVGAIGGPNNSNVRAVSGEISLRGFTFEDVAGMPDSAVAAKGTSVDDILVTSEALDP